MRETLVVLADTGLSVLDIEVMLLMPERDVRDFTPILEAAARLGAKHALTLIDIGDQKLATAKFAALCDLAAPFGIDCALESTAWLGVGSVQAARAVVEAAAKANGCLLLDPFHLFRGGGTTQDISSINPTRLRYAQFCDAPLAMPRRCRPFQKKRASNDCFPAKVDCRCANFCMPCRWVFRSVSKSRHGNSRTAWGRSGAPRARCAPPRQSLVAGERS